MITNLRMELFEALPVLLLELVPVLGVPGVEAAALPLPELRLLGLDLGQQRPAAQARVPGLQHAVVVGLNLSNIPTSILIVVLVLWLFLLI